MRPSKLDRMLDDLQRESFGYFLHEYNWTNGLVPDTTQRKSPCSMAGVGLALTAYPVGVVRGFMRHQDALSRTLTTLRFLSRSRQGPEPDATGYRGFYYHFLEMKTGRRTWDCELSTIDTALLLAGVLVAARYFDSDAAREREVRERSEELFRRVDWRWVQAGGKAVDHGWKPKGGFLRFRWTGYNEALILYALGLGSPSYPLPAESYNAWTATYSWRRIYDFEYLYAGPLFIHQLSHVWIDFRGIQDDYMRGQSIDYFENSRRATYAQREYAVRNPKKFRHYNKVCWGFTASQGPGFCTRRVNGIRRTFYGYRARGVPYGPDDGTIAPWVAVTSLPFAPEIVLPTIEYFQKIKLGSTGKYGFEATFNATYPESSKREYGWVSRTHYALNQGPLVVMIENYRSGLIWRLLRDCPFLVTGLRRAGFRGGWLG